MKKQIVLACILLCMCAVACKKETTESQNITGNTQVEVNTDSILYVTSKQPGFSWYLLNDSIKRSSNASAHSKFFRVRFNAVAKAALTDNGRLPKGAVFPQGSMIVKELFDSSSATLKLLAIMYKDGSHNLAVNGWVWLEVKADGGKYVSASEKGAQCVGCHTINSRDGVRLFDIF